MAGPRGLLPHFPTCPCVAALGRRDTRTTRKRGRRHPLLLTHMGGRSRAVYDALGHDVGSYASQAHRALLVRAATWLLDPG